MYALGDRFRKNVARHTLALLASLLDLRCSTDSTQQANGNAAGRCFVQDPTCDRGLFDGLLVDAFVSADSGSMDAIPLAAGTGLAFTVAGLCFAVWARMHLGK